MRRDSGRDSTGSGVNHQPDYRNISHNLSIEQTLQFLHSMLSNIIGKLESAQESLDEFDVDGDALGPGNSLGLFLQTQGLGLCVGNSGCSPGEVLQEVEGLVERLTDDLPIEQTLNRFGKRYRGSTSCA